MSTDRIVLVAKNGGLKLSEGDDSPWTKDGRMYDRPTTLVELAQKYPKLYDALLVALYRFKGNPTIKGSDWVSFEDNQT